MNLLWFRILDSLQSLLRRKAKEISSRRKWGGIWRDRVRPGRIYTRVDAAAECSDGLLYLIRPEPGWEWHCPNCHEYSIITESMMPAILEEWSEMAKSMMRSAEAKGKLEGFKMPVKPTASTAGCPNCKYRPGAPE